MEALLDQCLTSLILPDKGHREMLDVIVVIDGANDRSSEIAHRYANQFPEMFSVIDKKNGNYGSCINAALPQVKGKYVRILDADDSYNTYNLQAYIDTLNKIDVDLVLTDFITVDENGHTVDSYKILAESNRTILLQDISYEDFLPMHAVAYRSSIFNEIDYHQTEGISYTDLEWVFHPMSRVKFVYYYNKTIYQYLTGREGQTVDANVRLKRLGHMEEGLWSQLSVFAQIPKTNYAYDYLESVIKYRTKLLYTWGLDRNAVFDLRSFDKKLKEISPSVYKMADDFTQSVGIFGLQMHIVRMWRVFKKRNALLLFPLYDLSVIVSRFMRHK